MKYKVYTKTGDKGETSLFGGSRVPKNHPRIETYGTLDELSVFTGAIRDFDIDKKLKNQLIWIQGKLMVVSSILASEKETAKKKLPLLSENDILQLEKNIDNLDTELPELSTFIIPGGNTAVTSAHKARVICRRAERQVISLGETIQIDHTIIRFLNRLSDYFFVLSRKIAFDLKVQETYWKPDKY